jgi:opacity protein-like surface antigen
MTKLLGIFFVACCLPAWGQFTEIWFSAGEHLLSNRDLGTDQPFGGQKSDYQLTDGFRFAFRVVFNGQGHSGHEVQYAYNRTQLRYNGAGAPIDQGMAIHQGGYNYLLYANTEGRRIRPFATGGIGFSNFVPPGSSAARGEGSTKIHFSYGGGVKMRVTSIFALRFDLRQYASPKPFDLLLKEGWLRQTEISAGIGVYF